MVLEQFKNSVSDHVATYVSKRKPVTAYEAAVMADEFFLIHKTSFGSKTYGENLQKKPWRKSVHSAKLSRDPLGGQLHVFALSFPQQSRVIIVMCLVIGRTNVHCLKQKETLLK